MSWDIEQICIKKLLAMHEQPPICGCPNCKKERKENDGYHDPSWNRDRINEWAEENLEEEEGG